MNLDLAAVCADAILAKLRDYIDARRQQIRRVTTKLDYAWEDMCWQQLSNVRTCLLSVKAIGGVKYCVAEVLLTDDEKRIHDVLSTTHPQSSIFNQVVEPKEDDKVKARDAMDIRNYREMYHHIEPFLCQMVVMMQTLIWWDLEDCAHLTRFEWKAARIEEFLKGIPEDVVATYTAAMKREANPPTQEEIIIHELRLLKRTMDWFAMRREEEHTCRIIIKREENPAESVDTLIQGIAGQLNLAHAIRDGRTLDANIRSGFARALGCTEEELTPDKELAFCEARIADARGRLRLAINGSPTGKPYDLKRTQLEALHKRFEALLGDRVLPEPEPAVKPAPGGQPPAQPH